MSLRPLAKLQSTAAHIAEGSYGERAEFMQNASFCIFFDLILCFFLLYNFIDVLSAEEQAKIYFIDFK